MAGRGSRFLCAGLLVLGLLAGLSPAVAETRIALVITNQSYTQAGARLTNTYRDGDLVKAALERVGFKVWTVRDTASEGALLKAIGDHVQRLAEAGPDAVGFFYYSGHGAADRPNGENYLIPTDVPLTHVAQLPLVAVRLEKITATLASAGKMSFVVFDACRNVPLIRDNKDFGFKGFAPVREQNGLLVAFATEPGNVAVDQSLYAKALAEEMVKPGLEAAQVFRRVRFRVREETKRAQSPEYLDKRDDDFHFAASRVAVATPPPQSAPSRPAQPAVAIQPVRCDGVEALVGNEVRCLKPGAGKTEWFQDCPDCPEMAVVPAGRFIMGSPAEEPEREPYNKDSEKQVSVTISSPFAIGRFAVTRGEFGAFVSATGHKSDAGCRIFSADGYWKQRADASWQSVGFPQTDRHPVVCVNWDDVKAYVAWLVSTTGKSYRLPSGDEREYATRAGTTTPFWWGSAITPSQANYIGTTEPYKGGGSKGVYRKATVPVDSFAANPWGLYNVHGNVDDWTDDCYQTHEDRKVCIRRGGSWLDYPGSLRSAFRNYGNGTEPDLRSNVTGFRVARTLD